MKGNPHLPRQKLQLFLTMSSYSAFTVISWMGFLRNYGTGQGKENNKKKKGLVSKKQLLKITKLPLHLSKIYN